MKTYGGFRLSSSCWKILKLYKSEKKQDYTKTIEDAIELYGLTKDCKIAKIGV